MCALPTARRGALTRATFADAAPFLRELNRVGIVVCGQLFNEDRPFPCLLPLLFYFLDVAIFICVRFLDLLQRN